MKKVFMACAAALAMSIASCSSSTCYTCTNSLLSGVTATICDSKVTYTGLATGAVTPTFTGASNDDIKKAMELASYKCTAK